MEIWSVSTINRENLYPINNLFKRDLPWLGVCGLRLFTIPFDDVIDRLLRFCRSFFLRFRFFLFLFGRRFGFGKSMLPTKSYEFREMHKDKGKKE